MIRRAVNILNSHSFLLFGARGTGKTKLIQQQVSGPNTLFFDLLDPDLFDRLNAEPNQLVDEIKARPDLEWVVLDEVQKLPKLLDVVHQQVEARGIKFGLTGSSARKLRRGKANLLAGRAYAYELYPFTAEELGDTFDLNEALAWGTLPAIILEPSLEARKIALQTYARTYLREEIQIEQLIRNIDPFRRLLEIIGGANGQILNYSKFGRDSGTSDRTVQNYFQILADTLIGFFLEPYHTSIRKQQRQAPKFYLFDRGVQRALARSLTIPLQAGTYEYGRAFEHFIILELHRRCSYARNDYSFSYLRTKDDAEIDLILERPGKPLALIEIKSTNRVTADDISPLARFLPDFRRAEAYCISNDPRAKRIQGVECLHWQEGLRALL